MRGVLFLKTLRQVHYIKKLSRSLTTKYEENKEEDEYLTDDDTDDELSVSSIELDSLVGDLDEGEDNEEIDDDDPLINFDLRLNLSMDDDMLPKHRDDDFLEHCSLDGGVDMNSHDRQQKEEEQYWYRG